jgi:hypothetical protein
MCIIKNANNKCTTYLRKFFDNLKRSLQPRWQWGTRELGADKICVNIILAKRKSNCVIKDRLVICFCYLSFDDPATTTNAVDVFTVDDVGNFEVAKVVVDVKVLFTMEEVEEEGTDLSPAADSNVVFFDDDDVGLGDMSSPSDISGVIDISSSNR